MNYLQSGTTSCENNCGVSLIYGLRCVGDGKLNSKLFKYECDETRCKPPRCLCASRKPPGNLEPEQVPQMITLTFDDSISIPSLEAVRKVIISIFTSLPSPSNRSHSRLSFPHPNPQSHFFKFQLKGESVFVLMKY